MATIEAAFNPRHNSLNAIRLGLACIVIVIHSSAVGGYGPLPGFEHVWETALASFFVISGYLITSSRVTTKGILNYYWRRFLRIYPAFFVALLVVAVIIAPLSALISRSANYDWASALGYIVNNLAVYYKQLGIDGTLTSAPYGSAWNGSSWTLFYELLCYVGIGVLASIVPRKFLKSAVIGVFAVCTVGTAAVHFFGTDMHPVVETAVRLGGYFGAGAILFVCRDRIRLSRLGALLAAVTIITLVAVNAFTVFGGLPIAYLVMYLGVALPLSKVGAKNDFSYGTYIYGFPVQQVLALVFPDQQLPLLGFMGLSIAIAFPLGITSWFLIEKPALRLKHLWVRKPVKESLVASGPGSAAVVPAPSD